MPFDHSLTPLNKVNRLFLSGSRVLDVQIDLAEMNGIVGNVFYLKRCDVYEKETRQTMSISIEEI